MTHQPRCDSPHALYRRSPTLIVSWQDRSLIATDYALQARRTISGEAFDVLDALTDWTSRSELAAALPSIVPAQLDDTLDSLVQMRLVEPSDEPVSPRRQTLEAWQAWAPEAAAFHFGTKDGKRLSLEDATRRIYDQLAVENYPDVLKVNPRAVVTALPPFPRTGALPRTLLQRRTWRQFSGGTIPLAQIAALLGLTFGVQRWVRIAPEIRSALKTSPSGGACHSIEAYLVARRVDGVKPGIYHYRPDAHELECVRAGLPSAPIETYLGGQPWYRDCSALVFMTCVVPRVQWKYRFARAYRGVLLEAGHFCQTFCLVATWLRLAPFCTAAFSDSVIERALKIDGIDETIVYAAGVGTRPARVAWAPYPEGIAAPALETPAHAATPRKAGRLSTCVGARGRFGSRRSRR